MQRLADEVSGKKRRAANAPAGEEEDGEAEERRRAKRRREEEIRKGVEEHTVRSSLFLLFGRLTETPLSISTAHSPRPKPRIPTPVAAALQLQSRRESLRGQGGPRVGPRAGHGSRRALDGRRRAGEGVEGREDVGGSVRDWDRRWVFGCSVREALALDRYVYVSRRVYCPRLLLSWLSLFLFDGLVCKSEKFVGPAPYSFSKFYNHNSVPQLSLSHVGMLDNMAH
jgi:hypothetical protein